MLPSHLQELLTAAVDGEMTSAEQRLVDKLLRDSEEARQFHSRLQSDAVRLRRLPAAAPSDDLAANVMNLIDERCMLPTPLPMQRRRQVRNLQRLLPWISVATAAGVIIAVSLFSYYYIAAAQKQLAKKQSDEKVEQQPVAKDPAQLKHLAAAPHSNAQPEIVDAGPKTVKIDANPTVVALGPPRSEVLTVPPQVVGLENNLATPAQPEIEPFKIYQFHLPLVLPLRDLDEAYPTKRLREELRKDEVVRVDLFCKDGTQGAEILVAALKARGHQTLIDSMANDRIKKKMKSDFMFYTESMNADEIAKLLEQLGADDKKAETKKAGDGQFADFGLWPFAAANLSELAKLIGVPPAQLKLPKLKTAGGADATKSLESITANQLATNQPKSASHGNEKMTLVLPFGVNNHFPQNSKEIKNFLEKRGDRKTGAAPMMLILHTLN